MITNPERILKFLKKVKEATPTEISRQTKVHYDVVKLLLRALEEKGTVKKRTNENETFVYWSLKENTKGGGKKHG